MYTIYNCIQYTRRFNCTQKLNCMPIYKAIKLQSTQLYTSIYKTIQLHTNIQDNNGDNCRRCFVHLPSDNLSGYCIWQLFNLLLPTYCLLLASIFAGYCVYSSQANTMPYQLPSVINWHLAVVIANHVGHWARCIGYQFQYLLYSLVLLVLWQI